MGRKTCWNVATVFLALLVGAAAALPQDGTVGSAAPVDLRGIWRGTELDPSRAAERGLVAAEVECPRKVKNVAPKYPDEARRLLAQGDVELECVIDVAGVPNACRVVRARHEALEEAALLSVRQWRYEPLRIKGKPAPALVDLYVSFRLENSPWLATNVPVPPPTRPTQVVMLALRSTDSTVRAAAAAELAGAAESRDEAYEAVLRLRGDSEIRVRYAAEWALGHLAPAGSSLLRDMTPPKLVRRTTPSYPQSAFRAGVQGNVEVEILVGEAGEVAYAEVRKSIPELDAAALDCVRQWHFEPARVDGAARAVVASAAVSFQIGTPPPPGAPHP